LAQQIGRLLKEGGNFRDHLPRDGFVVGVAGLGSQFAEPPPGGPGTAQQTLLVAGTDQIVEVRRIELQGVCRTLFELSLEHSVGQLIGEFEALDQPVTNLGVGRVAQMADQPLAEPIHRLGQ
jgi:hypothetical protein